MDLDRWLAHPFLEDGFRLPIDAPFSSAQAQAVGISRRWLAELTRAGHLRNPIRGCYVPRQIPDDTSSRLACLRLIAPADAVVVDRHAGWAQGANMLLLPNEHLNAERITMFLPAGRGRLRNAFADSGERTFRDEDMTVVGGVRMTTPLRTALDLGRQRWPEQALTALDALHRLGTFTVDELLAELDRFKKMRWVRTLRLVAPHTDGRSQSGGETVVRWRWLNLPVAPPEPQIAVRENGNVAFIDVGHEGRKFGVEFMGLEWHTGDMNERNDEQRFAWLKDAGWDLAPVWTPDVYGRNARIEDVILAGMSRQGRTAS